MVPGSHISHAEMVELMAEDKYFKDLENAFNHATKDSMLHQDFRDIPVLGRKSKRREMKPNQRCRVSGCHNLTQMFLQKLFKVVFY